mmetsp:Transcript_5272/g.12697  ORF Transcript_5272/g.12697 Transcript_5272/m.12697 type:complete len:207 (+) Transcript_5272:1349-1969(+)
MRCRREEWHTEDVSHSLCLVADAEAPSLVEHRRGRDWQPHSPGAHVHHTGLSPSMGVQGQPCRDDEPLKRKCCTAPISCKKPTRWSWPVHTQSTSHDQLNCACEHDATNHMEPGLLCNGEVSQICNVFSILLCLLASHSIPCTVPVEPQALVKHEVFTVVPEKSAAQSASANGADAYGRNGEGRHCQEYFSNPLFRVLFFAALLEP